MIGTRSDPRRVVRRAYVLIAGIAVATICVTAYVNVMLSDVYAQSSAITERWTQRVARADELKRAALRIVRPLKEVYHEQRPASVERIHFELFASTFRLDVASARATVAGGESGTVAFRLGEVISRIELAAEAERVTIDRAMTLLATGRRDDALRLEPEVDKSADRLGREVEHLSVLSRSFHEAAVAKQHRQALLVQGFEYLIVLLLMGVVAASSLYARRLAEEMATSRQRGALLAQLQAREAEFRRVSGTMHMILNSAADGIFGTDTAGRTMFVNEAGAAMLGCTVDGVVGRPMHDLIHRSSVDGSPCAGETCAMSTATESGATLSRGDEILWREDGTSFPVEYVAAPLRDENGAVTGTVVTFRDLSERRAMEKMKGEFVSVVSHELRTPLTAIRGALGLIVAGLLGEMPEKAHRMLTIAVSNTDRLVRLINDILDIERIDSGNITLNLVRCHVRDLIGETLGLMRPVADQAQIRIETSLCEADIRADSDRITQTITNLVGNAIKFSPPQTTVSITATVDGDDVVFEIADQGRGIPQNKLESIFERFQQVDSSDSREKGGSGLGLAICRSIARQHGGEISVTSEVGRGSRFRFTVPRLGPVVTAPLPMRLPPVHRNAA